jgi:hypothetical protein
MKIVIGATGDGIGSNYSYRRCDQWVFPVGADGGNLPLETPHTWPQVWALIQTELALTPISSFPGDTLISSFSTYGGLDLELLPGDFQTWPAGSYTGANAHFGDLASAIGLAANHSAAALAGYNRLAGTTTWANCVSTWNDYPMCGITPR